MEGARLAYGFALGMLATVNPCGFALLPAYLAYYLGLTDDRSAAVSRGGGPSGVLRALLVSAAMTVGFLAVFTPIGLLWQSLASSSGGALPWITIALGVVAFGLGVAMLRGYEPVVRLPKLAVGKGGQEFWSMFVFGVSYALASLSCAMPLFVATMTTTFDQSFGAGLGTLIAFGLGMGVLVAALTVTVALARDGLVIRLRRLMRHTGRIGGAMLVVAGVLVAYTGWAELQTFADRDRGTGLYQRLLDWQASIATWIQTTGSGRVGLICLVIVVGAVGISALVRQGPNRRGEP